MAGTHEFEAELEPISGPARDVVRIMTGSEYAELHFEASVEEDDWALFETQIWWPPDYERREEMQFRVPTERLPAFAEQLREFVRLERGRPLKPSST
jgi:hypothetical protein